MFLWNLSYMTPSQRRLLLEVVDHEEYVDLDDSHQPVEATRTAFIHLKLPEGPTVRAQIPHENLDPLLAKMWPEDFEPHGDVTRSDP